MRDILHIIVYSLEEFIYSCEVGVLMIDINLFQNIIKFVFSFDLQEVAL